MAPRSKKGFPRRTHCDKGHEITGEGRRRRCWTCRALTYRAWFQRLSKNQRMRRYERERVNRMWREDRKANLNERGAA